jgi:Xaa-Pro aminopeptidase
MNSSIEKIRNYLKNHRLKAILVRSTDKYFNEYVPRFLSIRQHVTGFDGSVGDAIISDTGLNLFVDGRYALQASKQAVGFTVHVCQNNESIESLWLRKLKEILGVNNILAYDPETVDLNLFNRMELELKSTNSLKSAREIFQEIEKTLPDPELKEPIFKIELDICGEDYSKKHKKLEKFLQENNLDAFLIVKLDDIAWLTNLRSYCLPFQSSIPGIALITKSDLLLAFRKNLKTDALKTVGEQEFWPHVLEFLKSPKAVVGIDENQTSKAHEMALQALGVEIKNISNPITNLKAIKNEKELLHLRGAFAKADQVVYQTQNFVKENFEEKSLSEADVDSDIQDRFKKSGSKQLSFRPICASGKNGAIIHYGSPDRSQKLKEGSLFLLDTGAYYEGYATDLTRTFLVGQEAKPWQKEMFTLVLKASIAGLSARIRRGTLGLQLDAIVRAPLWQKGLDFAHGTGHGVGINVHEFPPRIGPTSTSVLLENQVFSIEPGLYFKDVGGVRIENLATVVSDPENNDFLRVLPLTFCPLDEKLIDQSMLDTHEQNFLNYFKAEWQKEASWPSLPPLKSIKF